MNHLSFGRKEEGGLENKNTIFQVPVRGIYEPIFDHLTGCGG